MATAHYKYYLAAGNVVTLSSNYPYLFASGGDDTSYGSWHFKSAEYMQPEWGADVTLINIRCLMETGTPDDPTFYVPEDRDFTTGTEPTEVGDMFTLTLPPFDPRWLTVIWDTENDEYVFYGSSRWGDLSAVGGGRYSQELIAITNKGEIYTRKDAQLELVPNPTIWYAEPSAVDHENIQMSARTVYHPFEDVQYSFECTAGGGNDSGWQDSNAYTDTGLTPETEYTYKAKSRAKTSLYETDWSEELSATTTEDMGNGPS